MNIYKNINRNINIIYIYTYIYIYTMSYRAGARTQKCTHVYIYTCYINNEPHTACVHAYPTP